MPALAQLPEGAVPGAASGLRLNPPFRMHFSSIFGKDGAFEAAGIQGIRRMVHGDQTCRQSVSLLVMRDPDANRTQKSRASRPFRGRSTTNRQGMSAILNSRRKNQLISQTGWISPIYSLQREMAILEAVAY